MNNNWFLTQQDDYINDISCITDSESFLNFLKIAFDTNPIEMWASTIFIIVVSIYINKKTSCWVQKRVSEYFVKRM